MKILTVAIPCYNSEAYMQKCIHSLLPAGDDIEILIVDDGSVKDRTAQIADEYEKKYPGIIRAFGSCCFIRAQRHRKDHADYAEQQQ